jgi:hypothetical protein
MTSVKIARMKRAPNVPTSKMEDITCTLFNNWLREQEELAERDENLRL